MAELPNIAEIPALRRVLIVDSSEQDAKNVETILRERWPGVACLRASEEASLRVALSEPSCELIISETDSSGFGVPSAFETSELGKSGLPLIVVSHDMNIESVIFLLKNGALDFVPKNKLERLVPAIATVLAHQKAYKNEQFAIPVASDTLVGEPGLTSGSSEYNRLLQELEDYKNRFEELVSSTVRKWLRSSSCPDKQMKLCRNAKTY